MANVGGKNGTEGFCRCPQNLQGPIVVSFIQLLLNFNCFGHLHRCPVAHCTRRLLGVCHASKKPQNVVAFQEQRLQSAAGNDPEIRLHHFSSVPRFESSCKAN